MVIENLFNDWLKDCMQQSSNKDIIINCVEQKRLQSTVPIDVTEWEKHIESFKKGNCIVHSGKVLCKYCKGETESNRFHDECFTAVVDSVFEGLYTKYVDVSDENFLDDLKYSARYYLDTDVPDDDIGIDTDNIVIRGVKGYDGNEIPVMKSIFELNTLWIQPKNDNGRYYKIFKDDETFGKYLKNYIEEHYSVEDELDEINGWINVRDRYFNEGSFNEDYEEELKEKISKIIEDVTVVKNQEIYNEEYLIDSLKDKATEYLIEKMLRGDIPYAFEKRSILKIIKDNKNFVIDTSDMDIELYTKFIHIFDQYDNIQHDRMNYLDNESYIQNKYNWDGSTLLSTHIIDIADESYIIFEDPDSENVIEWEDTSFGYDNENIIQSIQDTDVREELLKRLKEKK